MASTEPRIVDITTFRDRRGSLSVIDHPDTVDFDIARAYWIYDVPADAERDGHAMLSQTELLVALSGSFDVITRNASGTKHFHLDRNYRGLLLPPLTWREIDNFSTCSVALVVSSALYDENDYIRSFDRFQEIISAL